MKLSSFTDEHGEFREATRDIQAEVLSYGQRCPIILPRKHLVKERLLDYYDRNYRHANNETIVNKLRQKFTVSQLRIEVGLQPAVQKTLYNVPFSLIECGR